jgi:hypothetical protein
MIWFTRGAEVTVSVTGIDRGVPAGWKREARGVTIMLPR